MHSKNRKKIGPEVDEELWEDFREEVARRRGKKRGMIGEELEKALRRYMGEDEVVNRIKELREKVDRIDEKLDRTASENN